MDTFSQRGEKIGPGMCPPTQAAGRGLPRGDPLTRRAAARAPAVEELVDGASHIGVWQAKEEERVESAIGELADDPEFASCRNDGVRDEYVRSKYPELHKITTISSVRNKVKAKLALKKKRKR